jgi:hypothetical protein
MSDDDVKDVKIDAEEAEDEDAVKSVDFAALIDEDEPVEPADGANPDEVAAPITNRKVDLDGDDDGWEYADEGDDEETEESYEDSHE